MLLAGSGAAGGAPGAGTCSLDEPRPERVDLRCTAPSPGWAVLLDAWAPGWSATVDGVPAAIERADVVVRAVEIPAGEHTVSFRCRTPGLGAGLAVSALAWLLWIALRVLTRSKPRG